MLGWIILLIVVAAIVWVRAAPTVPETWHQPITADADRDMAGGAIRVRDGVDADALARVDAAARALPRTRAIAGSVADGRITYISRSRVWGFPDFTTVEQSDGTLKMFGRLRFGRSDFGVNRARLEQLLPAIKG